MKITLVRYERVYNLGDYQSERIGVEVSVDEDEDAQQALWLARATVRTNHEAARLNNVLPETTPRPQQHSERLATPTDPEPVEPEDDSDRMVPPVAANGHAVTDKQLKAIYAIGRAVKRLDELGVKDRCQEIFGCFPNELTKAEASQFIDLLKGEASA
jgi:hypothetical protein